MEINVLINDVYDILLKNSSTLSIPNAIIIISILFVFWKLLFGVFYHGGEKGDGYVLITGCDTGFGYDLALELNRRNIYVFAGCLSHGGVERLNTDDSFKGMAVQVDVSKEDDIHRLRSVIENEVKDEGLWCVVNNAGINQLGPVEWLTVRQMKKVMDINLWGMVEVTKAMLPLVKKARGRVVNMSSIFGRICTTNMAAYCMSKHAIEAFSDSLRYEMCEWGVTVHIIEPGSHDTGFLIGHEKVWDELWNAQTKQTQEEYGESFRKDVIVTMQRKARKISSDPKNVIKAYCHAVLSPRPKLRYLVGADANTIGIIMATLPTAAGDYLRRLLTPRVVPAAMK